MGADNWAVCPRCSTRKIEEYNKDVEEHAAYLAELYGTVSEAEYLAAANMPIPDLAESTETFREDYEYYFVDANLDVVHGDGPTDTAVYVHATYKGQCTDCGLLVKFTHDEPIDK